MNSRQVCIPRGFTVKFNWRLLTTIAFGFLLLSAASAVAQGKAERDKMRIGHVAALQRAFQ
jgi:hypothetical protein